ncbi:hypothetical protein [Amycolatopsis suaedae]|uniref:Uncharacterized protein n=1 Tax=Amycolatopsis suaedae TaxID=2510978 RepID=A0A4V2EMA8_9PSEU|nr:hypothetical protein [Amycolatopsis suaedae]RZQ64415.1 hypothetical protein EWH70_10675 [Amycolatopsis suaedae]
MSAFDVLSRVGTAALVRFTLALLAFVVVHLVRLPLLALAAVLERLMRRLDARLAALTGTATEPPRTRRARARRWGDAWGEPVPSTRPARRRSGLRPGLRRHPTPATGLHP